MLSVSLKSPSVEQFEAGKAGQGADVRPRPRVQWAWARAGGLQTRKCGGELPT